MNAHRAVIAGRLVISTAMQGQGAPIIDGAFGRTDTGRHYRGRAILLKPWKRGERSIRARALVIGWLTRQQVSPDTRQQVSPDGSIK